jgi:DNA mismatch endonuclease (patch repair protein)
MQANRRTNTKPEIRLRSALHRMGFRFRKDFRVRAGDVQVKPDIVFTRRRIAVFVDGCFWHGCPEHGRAPSVNGWYWNPKLERNRQRDARVTAALEAGDWRVLRFWEHESLDDVVLAISHALESGSV